MAEEIHSSPPPLTSPLTEEELLSRLRLLRSRRVGPATYQRLMREHGTADAALEALLKIARDAGVKQYAPCPEGVAVAEMRAGRRAGGRLLAMGTPSYPKALMDVTDAPPLLWARGDTALLARPGIAIVGARNASSLGLRMTRKLAADLGEAGFAVISGLARGTDTAAHRASLATGTIAVMAGGVDVIYPAENGDLAGEIAQRGLCLSEQPMGLTPQARHFPRRNRLVSGLARAVIVVEAAVKSGSLITAGMALDQGREVLVVPGHPFDGRASGCNMLIRDGATLIRGAGDVLEAIGTPDAPPPPAVQPQAPPPQAAPLSPAPPAEQIGAQILAHLSQSPVAEDQLIRDLGLAPHLLAPELTSLELEGRIQRQAGGLISLPG